MMLPHDAAVPPRIYQATKAEAIGKGPSMYSVVIRVVQF